jgi:serine/threonine-protein kinase HipA
MSRKLNVYLHGRKAGELCEDEQAQLTFSYEPDAKEPLSVRMPLHAKFDGSFKHDGLVKYDGTVHAALAAQFPHSYAFPFFENLIPEGRQLEIIAARMQIPENNPFSILEKIGGDCAGAVSLYEGIIPDKTTGPLREISEKEMARIIGELPENPLLIGADNPPRLSLAGAQSKFAVCKSEKKYFYPNDSYPSTQIIKIESSIFKNILHNELFCIMLGQSLGLNVPQVELCETDGKLFLDITRYDRFVTADKCERIHQEDFCQVLGYPSGKKYQADGGPSIRDYHKAIIKYNFNKITDSFSFLQWIAFNYIIGNTDAHAKNLSLLHKGGQVELAPFYDLLSTEIYSKKLTTKTAMLINGKDHYEKIRKKDFMELYKQLDLNPLQTMKNVSHRFEKTMEKAQVLQKHLNSDKQTESPVYDEIIGVMEKRISAFVS